MSKFYDGPMPVQAACLRLVMFEFRLVYDRGVVHCSPFAPGKSAGGSYLTSPDFRRNDSEGRVPARKRHGKSLQPFGNNAIRRFSEAIDEYQIARFFIGRDSGSGIMPC